MIGKAITDLIKEHMPVKSEIRIIYRFSWITWRRNLRTIEDILFIRWSEAQSSTRYGLFSNTVRLRLTGKWDEISAAAQEIERAIGLPDHKLSVNPEGWTT